MSPRKSSVRLVNQVGPLDPFDDPFGDRELPIERPRNNRRITPTGIQPVPEAEEEPRQPLPAPSDLGDPPADTFPLPREDEPEAMPAEEAPAEEAMPGDNDDAPAPPQGFRPSRPDPETAPLRPIEPAKPCDRIYNKRNCCDESGHCRDFRTHVAENTIQRISLNISPSIKPDAADATDEEQARALKLAESDIRSWRNRSGEVVARGQVVDLNFGRVHIEGEDGVAKIPVRQLSDDDWCFLAAWWGVPTECSLGDGQYQHRQWLASTMTWKASALCHKPLYFEEVQLERYGHTAGPFLQPAISGAHFFLNIAALPYKMGINPPNECRYALGYYRPGDCAPWLLPPVPLSIRGGLMEAGAIVGGIYVIP